MKIKLMRILGLLAMAAVATSCSSSGKLRSDYDDNVDFSKYKTYNFYEGAGPENDQYQSLFSQYMIAAITKEMEMRGYTKSNDPDLLVNFNANLEDKTKIRTTPASPPMGYYGYRGGFYDPWMGYGYGTETHVSQYTEGTFNIDLVDARQRKLVWEAVGIGRVTEKDLQNLEQGVKEGVPNFFAQYPFTAGSGVPVVPEK
jgi:hypothetical protein